jgi:PKD repeat protein
MTAKKNRCVSPLVISMIMMGILVLGSAMNVIADEPPFADADPDHQTVNVGEEVYFSGSGSCDRDGYIVLYSWDFGDGLVYHGENVNYTYNNPGDYTVTLTVEDDFGNTDSDSVTVTVEDGTPPPENMTVYIDSLTTDKVEYEINETVIIQVTVEREDDLLPDIWEGTLVLDIFDDGTVMVFTDEAPVYLPNGDTEESHNFDYMLAESGVYLIRSTLYDLDDNEIDLKETSIRVSHGSSGGNGTPDDDDREDPPDDGNETDPPDDRDDCPDDDDREDPPDDRDEYPDDDDRDDTPDDGNETDPPDDRDDCPDDDDWEDPPDDQDDSPDDRDGSVPSLSDEKEPSNENNKGLFTGDKGGIFQGESGWQIGLVAIVSIALSILSSFAIICYRRRYVNYKEKP